MIYSEKKQNLMEVPQGWFLAHCISADFALGAGVAKQIDEAFHMRKMLNTDENDWYSWEITGPACVPCGNVLNLVTKDKHWHKPTLNTLREALDDMKDIIRECGITKVAMPRIGCGLDRLDWADVKPMIESVFSDMDDLEIMVCVL